jgi:hypothetical protein
VTATTAAMQTALTGLNQALDAPRGQPGPWRHSVAEHMTFLRDCLTRESPVADDGWLADRSRLLQRERRQLLGRMSALGRRVQQAPEVDPLRQDLKRLLVDVSHHVQRLHDLAYDDVEFEVGGSE